jgi:ribonuclease HI
LIIHTDGGSRGNPGPAAGAFVAELAEKILQQESIYLGNVTNNVAEYEAVILALKWLQENYKNFSTKNVVFLLDSELVVKQINGLYKIKNETLKTLNLKIKKIISGINLKIVFRNIPREQNKIADLLVNRELDRN